MQCCRRCPGFRPGSVRWLHPPAPFLHTSTPLLLCRYAPVEKLEARQYSVARWAGAPAGHGGAGWHRVVPRECGVVQGEVQVGYSV